MKKNVIMIILICLFCIGCDAKYELNINEDLTVTENITGLETDTFYNQYSKSTKERVIDFMTDTKEEYLNEIGYTKEIVTEDKLTGAMVSKTFSSIEEYFDKSKAYTQFYENWEHSIKNGIVTIRLKNQLLRNEDSIERYVIDNCDISITLPFKVKKSNADLIFEETNTYTWELNDKESKDIYIQFDTTKTYEYESKNYISYIIIVILTIGVLIVIYNFYIKNKINNEI